MSKHNFNVGDLVKFNPRLKKEVYADYADIGIIVKKHMISGLICFRIVWFGNNKNNNWMHNLSCNSAKQLLVKVS